MKKVFFLFTTIMMLSASGAFCQQRSLLDLIGIWSADRVRVEFIDNSNVTVIFAGNKPLSGTYIADFFQDPNTLEITYQEENRTLKFKCLIQFLDNDTFKLDAFNKQDLPTELTDATIVLTRVKN